MYLTEVSGEGAKIVLVWKRDDPEDVEKARAFFTKQTRQGWLAVKQNRRPQRILEFNPEYGKIWFVAMSEGG
ncbi:MAG: hypothetical protein QG670_2044 [Thermoproteota archaeon]|nr:hypothetical protein [Thermoproteota archaeon]